MALDPFDPTMASHDRTSDDPPVGDATDPVVRNRYDWSETPPSLGVVLSFSELDDDPFGSERPGRNTLHDYVDPDALDRLFVDGDDDLSVAVSIEDFEVHLAGGEIAVYRTPA